MVGAGDVAGAACAGADDDGDALPPRLRPFPASTRTAAASAAALAPWAVSLAASALPLDAFLTFLSAALLEAPTVVFCPDLATLTACVLAVGGRAY